MMDRSWPPRLPDPTPTDFSFRGFVKHSVYIPAIPVNFQELRDGIVNATALVDATFFKKLWTNYNIVWIAAIHDKEEPHLTVLKKFGQLTNAL
jgi:hypothetical protein